MQHGQHGKAPAPAEVEEESVDPHETARFPIAHVNASAEELLLHATTREQPVSSVRALMEERFPSTETPEMFVFPAVICPDRATLTMIGGPDAGQVFDEPSVSRLHARITCSGASAYFIEDLGSTNGTFVGGRSVRRSSLRSGDRVQLGRECVFRFAIVDETEESFQRRLYESSMRDSLTGLANRRCLFERLVSEMGHAKRERSALSLLVMDVDRFKIINDTFGHVAGDQVLRAIAARGTQVLRAGDLLARYGGEEFAVLARDADRAEAISLAERLRHAISELRVEVGSGSISFTASIGVVSLSECDADADGLALFARADARLYAAKYAGRDRIVASDETTFTSHR
jgi:diguanylate cyclase (GGDEF)-like protein